MAVELKPPYPWPMCPDHDVNMVHNNLGIIGKFYCPKPDCKWEMEGDIQEFDENNPLSCRADYLKGLGLTIQDKQEVS